MRRIEAAKEQKKGSFFGGKGKESMSMDASASLEMAGGGGSKNRDKDAQSFDREAVDFFGRAIVQTKKSTSGSLDGSLVMVSDGRGGSKTASKTRIWYKFNEGFSNAVKAKVFISELL